MSNPNYDAILSSTFEKYTPKFEDNVFDKRPLLKWFKEHALRKIDGGAAIVEPLMVADNDTVMDFSGYDNLNTTPQEGLTAAQYPWRRRAASTAISGEEEDQNAGESRIIALLAQKVKQTENSLSSAFNLSLFTGTGVGKAWNGLDALVATTGVVGGIDRATNDYWKAHVDAASPDKVLTLKDLNNAYNTIHIQGKPDFEITTQELYEKYESLLQPAQRYQDVEQANAGFTSLTHKGTAVVYDRDCPAKTWFILNSENVNLVVHKNRWFAATPFAKPHGQDARYNQIICAGNLTTNNPRQLAKLTGRIDG